MINSVIMHAFVQKKESDEYQRDYQSEGMWKGFVCALCISIIYCLEWDRLEVWSNLLYFGAMMLCAYQILVTMENPELKKTACILLGVVSLGMYILPMIYVYQNVFAPADELPLICTTKGWKPVVAAIDIQYLGIFVILALCLVGDVVFNIRHYSRK